MAADLYLYTNAPKDPTDIVLRTSAVAVVSPPPSTGGRPVFRPLPVPTQRVRVRCGPAKVTATDTIISVRYGTHLGVARITARAATTTKFHAGSGQAVIRGETRACLTAVRAFFPDDLEVLLLAVAATS